MPRPRTGTAYEKNNKWYIGVRLRNGRKWATPCPLREDGIVIDQIHARAVAANLQRDYDLGKWDPEELRETKPAISANPGAPPEPGAPGAPVPTNTVPTVLEYARAWIKSQSYSTVADDTLRIDRYLAASALGSLSVLEVRPRHLIVFLAWLRALPSKRGGTLAPRSIRNIYSVVHRLFAHAVVAEVIPNSPCHLPRRAMPSATDKDPEARSGWIFEREEAEALMSDPRILPDRRMLYAILFLAGTRFGEVAALRWRDWAPELEPLGRLQIAKSIERATRKVKGTKTGVVRQVPVHPTLATLLQGWKATGYEGVYGRPPGDDDLLVPNRRLLPRSVYADNESLRRDCATLGIRYRSLHKTRRTLISLAMDDGVRGEVFEWITHDASKRSMRNQYTTLSWATLCAEMVKVRLAAPEPKGEQPQKANTLAPEEEPGCLATGLATAVSQPSHSAVISRTYERPQRDLNPCYRRERPMS